MEALVKEGVKKIKRDFEQKTDEYEGLLYMMYWKEGTQVVPLYIGKTEKFGKSDKLSQKSEKLIWAETLFESIPTVKPKLKKPTYFWMSAWRKGSIGPWKEFGSVSLNFLECLLIGLAGEVSAKTILNVTGVGGKL